MWTPASAQRAAVALTLTLLAPAAARAQLFQGGTPFPAPPKVTLKEPVAFRVYQRGANNTAEIPVTLGEAPEGAKVVDAMITAGMQPESRFENGKLVGVPPGVYTVTAKVEIDKKFVQALVMNVYVGDLWVLAGQSNMEGVGDLIDVTPPSDRVMALGNDGQWARAREPLHWLTESPDPVHSGDPATREQRAADYRKSRTKGAGLGLPFAVALTQATNVPIGLVIAAHGGTSMAQWDPAKKGEGGNSLYGSMLRQFGLAGGKVKGVLWYQGESDSSPEASPIYPKVFADFIAAVRSDFGQPDLPFYVVQIGRWIRPGDPKFWNAVQDAQRRIVDEVPGTAVVATVDLELDDGIHVGTQGLKRVGQRLARVAERELFGKVGGTTPTFERVNKGPNNTLIVKFKGVNFSNPNGMTAAGDPPGLKPARHITGFSVRKDDGADIPLIFDAAVGKARDTVILKLTGPVPEKASLWYGHGLDPACNLADGLDMAVPVFGPIPLDGVK